jgi:hypothetical protein
MNPACSARLCKKQQRTGAGPEVSSQIQQPVTFKGMEILRSVLSGMKGREKNVAAAVSPPRIFSDRQ